MPTAYFGFICPECKTTVDIGTGTPKCPNCGTEMITNVHGKSSAANVTCTQCNTTYGIINSDTCPQCGKPFN